MPLETEGKFKENIIAFAREFQGSWVVTVASRLLTHVIKQDEHPMGENIWLDTHVILPDNAPSEWLNAITSSKMNFSKKASIGDALKHFPVALLVST
jgi:(1->4)-alpha-D-glucan 1-alpha-D-glucosylmutase